MAPTSRPLGCRPALRRTLHLLRTVPRDRVTALALLDAVRGIPRLVRERGGGPVVVGEGADDRIASGVLVLLHPRGDAVVRAQHPPVQRAKKDRPEELEKNRSGRQQLALSAQNFAITTAIRALLDHARASDPEINDRLEAIIDARHATLEFVSDTDREFTERAKTYLSVLTGRPD